MRPNAPVAALPMYDFPEVAAANDALWRRIAGGLRARGVEAPARLARGREPAALWRDPRLIFGQTCGYPLMTALAGALALVATPQYAFPGCDGADHRALIVRAQGDPRRDLAEFRGAVAAVNSCDSNTGMNLFRATVAPLARRGRFFSNVVVTGSHAASIAAVAQGGAAIASIDCVTFGLLRRHRPALAGQVEIVAATPSSPGLPFVASAHWPESTRAAAREALFEALADPDLAGPRTVLGLAGARVLAASDYARVLDLEREAAALFYPRLA